MRRGIGEGERGIRGEKDEEGRGRKGEGEDE